MEKSLTQTSSSLVKIVLFGPESTGKTTLSKQLAKHYQTVWVEEYARPYLQNIWDTEQRICMPKDILPIAYGQINLENKAVKKANKILICDTDLLSTKIYSEQYYKGWVDPLLEKAAIENSYHLYLLTYIDTPWVADDLRDRPDQRQQMFDAFYTALQKYNKPFILLKGSRENRFTTATSAIDTLLQKNSI